MDAGYLREGRYVMFLTASVASTARIRDLRRAKSHPLPSVCWKQGRSRRGVLKQAPGKDAGNGCGRKASTGAALTPEQQISHTTEGMLVLHSAPSHPFLVATNHFL